MLGTSTSIGLMSLDDNFHVPFPKNTSYLITSYYGLRNDPINDGKEEFHNAVDLVAYGSKNVVASANGTVIDYYISEITGETVIIEHELDGIIYRTRYHHMQTNSVQVKIGQRVFAYDYIGQIGNTGQVTGFHLHFAIQKLNILTNEFEYINPSELISELKSPQ